MGQPFFCTTAQGRRCEACGICGKNTAVFHVFCGAFTAKFVCLQRQSYRQDGKTFEIGGRKKGQKQIAEAKEGYVVKDDIETGMGNVIPLWTFGMNY